MSDTLDSLKRNLQYALPWLPKGALHQNKIQSAETVGSVLSTTVDGAVWMVPPSACAYASSALAVANSTWTSLALDTERWDTGGIHSTTTNTSRMTIVTAGVYQVNGWVDFALNTTGMRGIGLRVGGSTYLATDYRNAVSTVSGTAATVNMLWKFAAGEYVELVAYQSSGGSLNASASELSVSWVSPG